MKKEHSFAKQYLKEQGYKLYIGSNQILNKNIPSFDIPDFNTRLLKDQDITETSEKIEEIDYSSLNRMGFMIVSERVSSSESWKFKQGVKYSITRMNESRKDYNQVPLNHFIEYDPVYKKIRLCGSNAGPRQVGSWIHLTRNKPSKTKISNWKELNDYLYSSLNPLANINKKEHINVPEIPVLITESGELVCIDPHSRNPPCIGATGGRGGGKTLGTVHNIADNLYLKNCGFQYHLNDRRNLFCFWNKPQTHRPFLKELELINHQSLRMPTINLYANTSDLKEIIHEDEGISFKTSVPFKDFVKDITYWTQRIKHFKLPDAALVVFRDLMEEHSEISSCKTRMELMSGLHENIDAEKDKKLFDALKRRLNDILNQKFLDISCGIQSKWTLSIGNKKREYSPLTASMLAGLVPINMTGHLFRKEFYPQLLRFLQDGVVDDLTNNVFGGKRVWAFFDEIQDIIKRGKVQTVASESIIESITGGRNLNLAIVWNTQTFNKLDTDIKTNTCFLFCFPSNNKDDLAEIKSSYNLPQKFINNIKDGKNLHAVLIPTLDEGFTVYSPDKEEVEHDVVEPFYGRIIPSMSFHKPPSYVEED